MSENFDTEAAEKEIEENPCNIKALSDLGQHYAYKGDFTSALKYYEKIVRVNEDNARAWSALGHCNLLKKDYSRCIISYQKALANKEESMDAQLWYGIAMLYFALEDWKSALKLFQAILEIKSDFIINYDVCYRLGLIFLREKSYTSAITQIDKALQMPGIPDINKIDMLISLAQAHSGMGNVEKSIEAYQAAKSIDHKSIKSLKAYAWECYQRKRYEEAIEILQQCLNSGKISSELHYLQGRCFQSKGCPDNAREEYSKALSICSTCSIYWVSAGILYAEAKQEVDAFECFSKASTLTPDCCIIWNNIGLLYSQCGQKPEADLAFQKALQLGQSEQQSSTLVHLNFEINEPIFEQPKQDPSQKMNPDLQQLLERSISKEIFKIVDGLKSARGTGEKVQEIIVPKVNNSVRSDRAVNSDVRTEGKAVHPGMIMMQNLMMNPGLFYQMMLSATMNAGMAMGLRVDPREVKEAKALKVEKDVKEEEKSEEKQGKGEGEGDDQIAKALIEMTEDSLRKKRKSDGEVEEPIKKVKEEDN